MREVIECVPNFSTSDPAVVESILNEIRRVRGAYLLDHTYDDYYNRLVVTYVGDKNAVYTAALNSATKAIREIDMDKHKGQHPRIGAADVVPFIPISDVSMQECVEIAERLGERVGRDLNLPVYLYEQAARCPERRNLENIRRGEYETLKEEIGKSEDRKPDYGPSKLGPAGATVIGARHFLVAYNVYLTTDDVSIAKKIAKSVRHSSGGLRYVKAIGLLVEGRAQVSMNLTDFHRTPLARVVELIRREARRYGVDIHHSELVGLIPEEALVDAAVWYTQLDEFDPNQILERRLYATLDTETAGREGGLVAGDLLDDLASNKPTPGGGSAAAFSAAAAAALVEMVASSTIGKERYKDVEEEMEIILERASALRVYLTSAVEQDAVFFRA